MTPGIQSAIDEIAGIREERERLALLGIQVREMPPTAIVERIFSLEKALAGLRAEMETTRANLFAGLDRDKDDITTPHLATVAANTLADVRELLEKWKTWAAWAQQRFTEETGKDLQTQAS